MNTRIQLRLTALTAAIGGLAFIGACNSSSAPATGTVVVQLTDAAFSIDSVARVDVFVLRVDGRVADADSAAAARGATADSTKVTGWTTLATPNQSINLLAFQAGLTFPAGQAVVPAGSYRGFRLVIDPSRSSVTLKNGQVLTGTSSPNVSFPSGATSGLKVVLTQPVVVAANGTTILLVDFDLANSFVLRGASLSANGLLFKPVIRGSVR